MPGTGGPPLGVGGGEGGGAVGSFLGGPPPVMGGPPPGMGTAPMPGMGGPLPAMGGPMPGTGGPPPGVGGGESGGDVGGFLGGPPPGMAGLPWAWPQPQSWTQQPLGPQPDLWQPPLWYPWLPSLPPANDAQQPAATNPQQHPDTERLRTGGLFEDASPTSGHPSAPTSDAIS